MDVKVRRTLILLVKLAVAGALLAYLFTQVDWQDFHARIRSARLGFLAAAMVCFIIPNLVLAVRWRYLLRIQRIRVSVWESVRLTFLGTFFNAVIPGAVSGDLAKAYYVARHSGRGAAVLVSIFVDRAVGLLEFCIMPAIVMAILLAVGAATPDLAAPAVIVAIVLVGVTVSMALLMSPRLRATLHLQKVLARLPLQRQLAMAGQAAALYGRRVKALAVAAGMTLVSQVIFIFGVLLVGEGLGLPVPWHMYYVYVPLICILTAVPISPGALGVMEVLYVQFFTAGGAAQTEAIALALTIRVLQLLCTLPGLAVVLTGPKLPPKEQLRKTLPVPPQTPPV